MEQTYWITVQYIEETEEGLTVQSPSPRAFSHWDSGLRSNQRRRQSLAGNIHASLSTGQLKHSVVQPPGKLQHAVGTEAQ